ncbi:MAG TPA: beta-ketoacyl synthase N-terminal-like domain-containing protein [Oculatellaceae cyanobacterium]
MKARDKTANLKTSSETTPKSDESQRGATEIAIVGMACSYPGAPDLNSFWKAIVRGEDCTRTVTDNEWAERYYNRQSAAFEQAYCGKGGFIEDIEFDPIKYGVMPNSVNGADTDQFAVLKTACDALTDAGLDRNTFNGDRAEVLIGRIGAPGDGVMNMIQRGTTITQFIDILKKLHPEHTEAELTAIADALKDSLKPCSADTIPGVMPNIMAGRIAGRLGCKGRSMVIDAACASSLIAIEIGVRDLQSGMCDLVLAGGVHINSVAVFYQMFCGLGALSRREIISPFDDQADGTLLGDGVGIVVLKRLAEAERDGDRIYAVIKGVGSSSDGVGTSMLAPSWEGEALAMRRAYEMAQISPRTVELLEAHGTATPTGDVTEMTAVQKVFQADDEHRQWCALGSVKSNFGHTQAAAGVAGVIKTALALYQKILPPTLKVNVPNKQIDWKNSPCYINQRSRIWIHPQVHAKVERSRYPELNYDDPPRRAAVSAFGFGGVNAHLVMEEHLDPAEAASQSPFPDWDSEVFLFAFDSDENLVSYLKDLEQFVQQVPRAEHSSGSSRVSLKDVAYTVNSFYQEQESQQARRKAKASIVATSLDDLQAKLAKLIACLEKTEAVEALSSDINLAGAPDARTGKLAFVLPGLGAAYPNMLADLSAHFPDVRAVFDFVDQLALAAGAAEPPSAKVFPNPFKVDGGKSSTSILANEDSAVVMLLMAEWALYTVLQELGIKADALVGVSTGEFAVLNISGASDIISSAQLFYKFSTAVARGVPQDGLVDLRSMKVDAPADDVLALVQHIEPPVYLAAALSPQQTLISGDKTAIAEAQKLLKEATLVAHMLPTAIPYHTPLVAGHIKPDNEELNRLPLSTPKIESWSCSMASQYPQDVEQLREITTNLFTRPIRLTETISKLYERGVTKFIEVGPKGTLTSVIDEILEDKPHLAVASNRSVGSAIHQLNLMVGALACHDVPLDIDYLFKRRSPVRLNLQKRAGEQPKSTKHLRMTYPNLALDDITAARLRQSFQQQPTQAAQFQNTATLPLQDQPPVGADFTGKDLLATGLLNFQQNAQQAQLILQLTVNDHQYLLDHAIGGIVSTSSGPERVFLLPLTVALELMTEAAALLMPGKLAVKLENIRALRRIKVGLTGTKIALSASIKDSGKNRCTASITILNDDFTAATVNGDNTPAMSCDIVFQTEFSKREKIKLDSLVADGRTPLLTQQDLYTQQTMFHGPRMQSVTSLTRVNKKQILGTVAARDAGAWLSTTFNPQFCTNPLLLDNATQLVLFHLYEYQQPANALLPFLVESLELFADLNSLRGEIFVFANLTSLTQRGTEADVTLIAGDGTVLAKFNTICSRRIILDEPWRTHIYEPISVQLPNSKEHQQLQQLLPISPLWATASFANDEFPADEVTLTWLMDYIFSAAEQRHCELTFKTGQRRREWLLGRLAAKQAVRNLLLQVHGVNAPLADIVIGQDESGKPWVGGEFLAQLGWAPLVSLTHKNNSVVAIAAHPQIGASIGIDLEVATEREQGFETLAFTDQEQQLLLSLDAIGRPLMIAALWSAKEAAAKATGIGLRNNPKTIQITPALNSDGRPCFGPLWQAEILNTYMSVPISLPVIINAFEAYVLAVSCWAPVSYEQAVASTY